jgi:hypothetical protein
MKPPVSGGVAASVGAVETRMTWLVLKSDI